jgi:Ca-activated chloride channel homolog
MKLKPVTLPIAHTAPIISISSILSIIALAFGPSSVFGGELEGVLRNNEGVKKFAQEQPVEAYDKFSEALAELPFSGLVHFNLGTTFLVNKEVEKALSEYKEAVRQSLGDSSLDKEVLFRVHFNLAYLLAETKKVEEALGSYQDALKFKPDSIETKTNMELLVQNGGGGGGEGEDKKDQQPQSGNQDQKDQGEPQKPDPKQQQSQKPKGTPRPFKSQELSQQDVQKILEELKRQEEAIRARNQSDTAKDAPADKDW